MRTRTVKNLKMIHRMAWIGHIVVLVEAYHDLGAEAAPFDRSTHPLPWLDVGGASESSVGNNRADVLCLPCHL